MCISSVENPVEIAHAAVDDLRASNESALADPAPKEQQTHCSKGGRTWTCEGPSGRSAA